MLTDVLVSRLSLAGSTRALVLARPAMPHVDGSLLLAGQSLGEKVTVAAFNRRAGHRDVFQGIQIVHYLRPEAGLLQVTAGVGVLGIDEGPRLGAFCILEQR